MLEADSDDGCGGHDGSPGTDRAGAEAPPRRLLYALI